MYKQSVYCNYLDIGWYSAVSELLDTAGYYRFDKVLKSPGVTLDEVITALEKPEELPVERQRALALCAVGTGFETDALHELVFSKAIWEFDVFFIVASCYLRNEDLLDGMRKIILSRENLSLEEKIFSLQIFEKSDSRVKNLIFDIVSDLQGKPDFIIDNIEVIWWLFERNIDSVIYSEFFTILEKIIRGVPDTDSFVYGKLMQYGFNVLDITRMVWCVRSKIFTGGKGAGKTSKAKNMLKYELAKHFRAWTTREQDLVKSVFKGDLGIPVSLPVNYKWYYYNVGFSLPELSINLKDDNGKFTLLKDSEKCLLAKEQNLSREEVLFIGAKFEEWNPDLFEYYNTVGTFDTAHKYYDLSDMDLESIQDLDTIQDVGRILAKVQQVKEFSDETVLKLIPFLKQNSLKQFVRVITESNSFRYLEVADRVLYNKVRYSFNSGGDLTFQEYNSDLFRVFKVKSLKKYVSLFDLSVFDDDELYLLDNVLQTTEEDGLEVLKLLSIVDRDYYVLKIFAKTSCVLSEYPKYLEMRARCDDITKYWLQIAATTQGRWFREWTGLTLYECYCHYDNVFSVFNFISEIQSCCYSSAVYKNTMPVVVRDWVLTGSPLQKIFEVFGSWSKIPEDYVARWIQHGTKEFSQVSRLSEMSLCCGKVNGHEYWLTTIGLISVDNTVCDIGIPVWCLDPSGDEYLIEFDHPLGDTGLYVPWLEVEAYGNTSVRKRLKRLD